MNNNKKLQPENPNKKNNKGVLDTSALRALFYDEAGADVVYRILDGACISTVSLAIFLNEAQKAGGDQDILLHHIETLELQIFPFDYKQVCIAAQHFYATSLECRAAIALAMHLELPLYSSNAVLSKLNLPITLKMLDI